MRWSSTTSLYVLGLLFHQGSTSAIHKRGTVDECNQMNAPAPITALNTLITDLSQSNCASKSFPATCTESACSSYISTSEASISIYGHGTAFTVSCAEVASLVTQGIKECGTGLNRTDTTFQISSDADTFDVLVTGYFSDPGSSCATNEESAPVDSINSLLSELQQPNCSSKTAPVGTFASFLESSTAEIEIIAIAGSAVDVTCAQAAALVTQGLQDCTVNNTATFYVESADKSFAVEVTGRNPPAPAVTCNEMNGEAPISALTAIVQKLQDPGCAAQSIPAAAQSSSCFTYLSNGDATVDVCPEDTSLGTFQLACAEVAELMQEGIKTCGVDRTTTTFDIDSSEVGDERKFGLLVIGGIF